MGNIVGNNESPKKGWIPETKLEAKTVKAMKRRAFEGSVIKSFNNLDFPRNR